MKRDLLVLQRYFFDKIFLLENCLWVTVMTRVYMVA